MGGRGAAGGYSIDENGNIKNPYGSQYHTLLKRGNIKFVQANERHSESLLETMTPGRVYVTVGGNDLLQIMYYDNNGKRKSDNRSKVWNQIANACKDADWNS